jgi:hypothetical protein
MKKIMLALSLLAIISGAMSCKTTGSMAAVQPTSGAIELPAKGEYRMWKGTAHPSFTVTLTNSAPQQSCEIYTVKSSGTEKWISPSLMANSSLTVTVPADGHLFFKNFNANTLTITYKVNP